MSIGQGHPRDIENLESWRVRCSSSSQLWVVMEVWIKWYSPFGITNRCFILMHRWIYRCYYTYGLSHWYICNWNDIRLSLLHSPYKRDLSISMDSSLIDAFVHSYSSQIWHFALPKNVMNSSCSDATLNIWTFTCHTLKTQTAMRDQSEFQCTKKHNFCRKNSSFSLI